MRNFSPAKWGKALDEKIGDGLPRRPLEKFMRLTREQTGASMWPSWRGSNLGRRGKWQTPGSGGRGPGFGCQQEVYGGAVASSLQHSPRQAFFSAGALTTLLLGHCHRLTLLGLCEES